ncbi:transposase [Microvirga tunisiensis]|uniref:Transposase n=1 Tax=Microvirga tunisiensis TaxID=2108360 RepID=A0A5N7MX84_9HYPH|nr:transposase [Microvirga tunisiensis]MPR31508.1 transposase [Microvirga tunisiensis]
MADRIGRREGDARCELVHAAQLPEVHSDHAGVALAEVNEAYTTQTCTECDALSGPHGREGLAVRQWVCSDCGAVHDRDRNAALNIARLGCETLGLKGPGSRVL